MLKKASHYLLLFILIVGFSACSEDVIIDVFEELPSSGWEYDDAVEFEFEIEDISHYYQIWTNLQINGDYSYSNFFIKTSLTAPDSSVSEKEVELILAEKSGKWLGSGLGDIISFQLKNGAPISFKQKGKYHFRIEQYSREEVASNIKSIGIKVETKEEIF